MDSFHPINLLAAQLCSKISARDTEHRWRQQLKQAYNRRGEGQAAAQNCDFR
jgi:hypothetical protein